MTFRRKGLTLHSVVYALVPGVYPTRGQHFTADSTARRMVIRADANIDTRRCPRSLAREPSQPIHCSGRSRSHRLAGAPNTGDRSIIEVLM